MTLRVCLNRLVFLLFSLARELSPFRLHEHVLSLLVSKLFIISLVFSLTWLPPASLSLVLLHFNCDFHGHLIRSRSTCIKCPSGINLLLVIWKDSLFITSVWRFFAANGKSVLFIIAASFALCTISTIVATDEELHSGRIHNNRIDTTVNSYEGTTRHRAFV